MSEEALRFIAGCVPFLALGLISLLAHCFYLESLERKKAKKPKKYGHSIRKKRMLRRRND